ncbi:hypothetical protein C6P40_005361, partial [Pichia californica]
MSGLFANTPTTTTYRDKHTTAVIIISNAIIPSFACGPTSVLSIASSGVSSVASGSSSIDAKHSLTSLVSSAVSSSVSGVSSGVSSGAQSITSSGVSSGVSSGAQSITSSAVSF